MSAEQQDGREPPQGGVLAALPRTRPQRASARRVAARARTQSETAALARASDSPTGARGRDTKAKPSNTKAKASDTKAKASDTKTKARKAKRPAVGEQASGTAAAAGEKTRAAAAPAKKTRAAKFTGAKATTSEASVAKSAAEKKPTAAGGATVRRSAHVERAADRSRARGAQERAPKQGYEPEEKVELGQTVHPPTGVELVESIADIFGELANAGASAGGRLLKDALSIFRRP